MSLSRIEATLNLSSVDALYELEKQYTIEIEDAMQTAYNGQPNVDWYTIVKDLAYILMGGLQQQISQSVTLAPDTVDMRSLVNRLLLLNERLVDNPNISLSVWLFDYISNNNLLEEKNCLHEIKDLDTFAERYNNIRRIANIADIKKNYIGYTLGDYSKAVSDEDMLNRARIMGLLEADKTYPRHVVLQLLSVVENDGDDNSHRSDLGNNKIVDIVGKRRSSYVYYKPQKLIPTKNNLKHALDVLGRLSVPQYAKDVVTAAVDFAQKTKQDINETIFYWLREKLNEILPSSVLILYGIDDKEVPFVKFLKTTWMEMFCSSSPPGLDYKSYLERTYIPLRAYSEYYEEQRNVYGVYGAAKFSLLSPINSVANTYQIGELNVNLLDRMAVEIVYALWRVRLTKVNSELVEIDPDGGNPIKSPDIRFEDAFEFMTELLSTKSSKYDRIPTQNGKEEEEEYDEDNNNSVNNESKKRIKIGHEYKYRGKPLKVWPTWTSAARVVVFNVIECMRRMNQLDIGHRCWFCYHRHEIPQVFSLVWTMLVPKDSNACYATTVYFDIKSLIFYYRVSPVHYLKPTAESYPHSSAFDVIEPVKPVRVSTADAMITVEQIGITMKELNSCAGGLLNVTAIELKSHRSDPPQTKVKSLYNVHCVLAGYIPALDRDNPEEYLDYALILADVDNTLFPNARSNLASVQRARNAIHKQYSNPNLRNLTLVNNHCTFMENYEDNTKNNETAEEEEDIVQIGYDEFFSSEILELIKSA